VRVRVRRDDFDLRRSTSDVHRRDDEGRSGPIDPLTLGASGHVRVRCLGDGPVGAGGVRNRVRALTLTQGRMYRAELDLPFYVPEAVAQSKLEAAGFIAVDIYHVEGKRYVQGLWSRATLENAPIDSHLSNVTEVGP
jgi:hypothetical protein